MLLDAKGRPIRWASASFSTRPGQLICQWCTGNPGCISSWCNLLDSSILTMTNWHLRLLVKHFTCKVCEGGSSCTNGQAYPKLMDLNYQSGVTMIHVQYLKDPKRILNQYLSDRLRAVYICLSYRIIHQLTNHQRQQQAPKPKATITTSSIARKPYGWLLGRSIALCLSTNGWLGGWTRWDLTKKWISSFNLEGATGAER